MCTAISIGMKDHYFGRTLDLERGFGEEIVATPRNMPLDLREAGVLQRHHAILGMAHVAQGQPLYFDGINEKGLAMAALNFPGYAWYGDGMTEKYNVPHFGLISWILGQCGNVQEAHKLLKRTNVTGEAFSDALAPAQLHWMIADREGSIVVECTRQGMQIHRDPVGVLTNNPPFDQQLLQLNNFMHLSPEEPKNHFSDDIDLKPYSRGMGALGLPGDLSSQSRFVRAAFTKLNAEPGETEEESVSQFFHILGTVEQTKGCCRLSDGSLDITRYTCCCNTDRGIYYYTSYENRSISAADLNRADLEGEKLLRYPLDRQQKITWQN